MVVVGWPLFVERIPSYSLFAARRVDSRVDAVSLQSSSFYIASAAFCPSALFCDQICEVN